MEPLVSVIIPNYNYARFLVQRIDSVLGQTYSNTELIILDDASTDGSRDVIEAYRNEPKVKHIIFNEVNSGSTFKQWEQGFESAKGDFIWIAECDDYADRFFLEKILSRMQADATLKIGFSNSYWVTPEKSFINKDYTISEPLQIYEGKSFIRHHLLKENFIYNASMAVFRKDALKGVDPEVATYKSCGDKLFWSSLAAQGRVLFVCEPLNYFRIHPEKVTSNSIANGTLFKEEHRFFVRNIRSGYITWANRLNVVSYFVDYVRRTRPRFLSEAIYEECLNLWESERDYRNPELPLAYRWGCYLAKICRKTA
ncbi:MAG: glycosyltransferase [Paraprevotella sp.]|nr:glycosyltransferase [Paraprevotella sp.]